MTAQGRLSDTLGIRAQHLVYGELTPAAACDELSTITTIDMAHVVMLAEQELIERRCAALLLERIHRLRAENFAPLRGLPAPRGVYLMYEDYLIRTLGADIGGRLHIGRSRNDLKATATAIRWRAWALDFVAEAVRLQAVLLSRARTYRDVVMPIYTHFQAAMPMTYGHYLVGVTLALSRDTAAVADGLKGLSVCPMGAGAVAGSDLPIKPARVAELLGFDQAPVHAVDAVASRDAMLRLLSAVSGVGLTLSRFATDMQLWSTSEFGFVAFPDRLVGGSSAMPQKRNAFMLEHVKAKAAICVGAWTAVAAAIKSTPFTNTIEVGTEAVGAAWPGLGAARDSVLMCQLLASAARPQRDRMTSRAEQALVTATQIANRLTRYGVPFRAAHTLVGEAVRQAVQKDCARLDLTGLLTGLPREAVQDIPVEEASRSLDQGGGPGAFSSSFAAAHEAAVGQYARCEREREAARVAGAALAREVERLASQSGSIVAGQ
jgi:argininosuccinate lyase